MNVKKILREIFSISISKREFSTRDRTICGFGRFSSTVTNVKKIDNPQATRVQKTGLFDLHVAHEGKMVNFAGYYLPVQYNNASISSSHLHTRSDCSIFDVSHMLQTIVNGQHAVQYLETLCVTDINEMKRNESVLSVFTNDLTGGIIDDFIITKVSPDCFFLVSNASRRNCAKQLLLQKLDEFLTNGKDVRVEFLDSSEQSLIAVQGPKTAAILQPFVNIDLAQLYFMNSEIGSVCGVENSRITRCGYTGEDGVEIAIPTKSAIYIVENILKSKCVQLAGLGARNTLRLEAGLCLYGDDINEDVTPVEAGLAWVIGKRRKYEKNYPGSDIITKQLENGMATNSKITTCVSKKRVGIVKIGGPPARSGTSIIGFNDEIIGHITSGCPSPSLGINIAMGYVNASYAKIGTEVRLKIRESMHDACISKMPFIQTKYYTKPKLTKK